jgi:predicted signal transduction protein with EAL and GGDEF domain
VTPASWVAARGDLLLRTVADHVLSCLRKDDRTFRIGGSEFALILPGLKTAAQPRMAVGKIQRVLAEAVRVEGREIRPRLSFDVSVFPIDAADAGELLRCADIALLQARVRDAECVHYAECAESTRVPMVEMGRELESAVRNGDIEARYQPIVDLKMGTLVGVEMLSGWTSSAHGVVQRDVFMEIARRSALTIPLTLSWMRAPLRVRIVGHLHWRATACRP